MIYRKNKAVYLFTVLLSLHIMVSAQKWETKENYITCNDEKIFLTGVNYIPSENWLMILEKWNPEVINSDLKALKSIGVDYIRFCPLWHLTQPSIGNLDSVIMKRIDYLFNTAHQNEIKIQIGPITGWMSGGVFLPDWANGNIFKDKNIIDGELHLIAAIAERYKDHPALMGYDFGNEINVLKDKMNLEATPEDISKWMNDIYKTYKSHDSHHLVTNGIGTGFNNYFNIWDISKTSDYMSVHSYPYFHGTWEMDPWIGLRTTYSSNFIAAWAEMTGKPVLIQEIGASEDWMHKLKIPEYLKINYISNWADGATGFFWWCSHNIDRNYIIFDKNLYTEYSFEEFKEGNFHELDYELGLLDNQNVIKPVGYAYQNCTEIIEQLGNDWIDQLPKVYVIIPHDLEYHDAMLDFITPYVIAKQIHVDVLLWPEKKPIPDDAEAVILSNYSLSNSGKAFVSEYLKNGGNVFQSFYNDFNSDFRVKSEFRIENPGFIATEKIGAMNIGQKLYSNGKMTVKEVQLSGSAKEILIMDMDGNELPVLFETAVGKGKYYYLACNWEKMLKGIYNPWLENDINLVYSVLNPNNQFQLNNKFVEFYNKSNSFGENILILINHTDEWQPATVNSEKPYYFTDFHQGLQVSQGLQLNVNMQPGGVKIFKYKDKTNKK